MPPKRKFNEEYNDAIDRRQGLALVIALGLMAFLLTLALSLSLLLGVETVAQDKNLQRLKARQNARLAAYVALGELQRHMGPDRRVSARADLLSTGPNRDFPADGVPPFQPDPKKRFWTGVWRSDNWDPGDNQDRQGRFERWLTSLPNDKTGDIRVVAEPPGLRDSVRVTSFRVPPLSGGQPENIEVRAPLIDIGDSGAIAWWVSDEGTKANPGLVDPYRAQREGSIIEDIPRYIFPHRFATKATEWFENIDFNDSAVIDRLSRFATGPLNPGLALKGLNLSKEAETAFREGGLAEAFSFKTLGVLSDNRRGGLRGDLSLALWRDPSERYALGSGAAYVRNEGFEADFRNHRIFNKEDYPDAKQSIRSPAASGSSFFGPRWEILRDYHNAYRKLVDPMDLDSALTLSVSNLGRALYDVPRSRSADSWQNNSRLGRIILPSVIGGRSANDQDPIQKAGDAAVPGEQITGIDTGLSGPQPVENTRSGLYPLMQRASIFFNLDMREIEDPANPGNPLYAPRINAYAIVHFWNPHNVTLTSLDPVTGQSAGPWMADIISDVEFGIERKASDGTVLESVTFDYDQLRMAEIYQRNPGFNPDTSVRRTEFHAEAGDNLFEFRPGEIRAFVMKGTTTEDEAESVVAGTLRPFFTSPRVFIPYEKTGGPLIDWGANKRTNDPFLFKPTDRIRVTLDLQRQLDAGSFGFVLNSAPKRNYNRSFTQSFRWILIDDSADIGFEDEIPLSRFINDPSLAIELGGVEMRMKPADTDGSQYPSRILANFNPRAIYNHTQMGFYAGLQPPNYEVSFLPGDPFGSNGWNFETVDGKTLLRGSWGASDSDGVQNFVSLFDVPRRPPESLGQYQHAHLAFYPHQPAYPFGNSLADPHIRRDAVIDRQNGKTQMDLSWLLNDAIWDRYFLSTIDPDRPVDGRPAPLRSRFVELQPDKIYDISDPEGYRKVAENLLLRGPFNVNSTSVEAWAAILGATSGEGIKYFDTASNGEQTSGSFDFGFFRQSIPNDAFNTAWRGGPRSLSRDEVRALASAIVEQIRQRGPFLSLADFVNRRLTQDERGLKGALQSSIDAVVLSNPSTGGGTADLPDAPFPAHASGEQADFAPGDLSQADILTSIGPALSVRSDTFVIRAYGRDLNVEGESRSDAWCELHVQRMPTPLNADFGRPFRILDFRWLGQDDI